MSVSPLTKLLTTHPSAAVLDRISPELLVYISPAAARAVLISPGSLTLGAHLLIGLADTVVESGGPEDLERVIAKTPHLDIVEYLAHHALGDAQPRTDRALLNRGHIHSGLRDTIRRSTEALAGAATLADNTAVDEWTGALLRPWHALRARHQAALTDTAEPAAISESTLSDLAAAHNMLLTLGYQKLLTTALRIAQQADRIASNPTTSRAERDQASDRADALWQLVRYVLAQLRTTHPDHVDDLIAEARHLPLILELARPNLPRTWEQAFNAALTEIRTGVETTPVPAHNFLYFNHKRLTETETTVLHQTIREHPDTLEALTRARWLTELAATPAPDDDWAALNVEALRERLSNSARALPAAAAAALSRRDIDTDTAADIARRCDHHKPFFTARPWDPNFIARQVAGAIGWVKHLPPDSTHSPLHPSHATTWQAPAGPGEQAAWICDILNRALALSQRPRDLRGAIDNNLPAPLAHAVARTRPWHELDLWLREPQAGPLLAEEVAALYVDSSHGQLLERFVSTGNADNLPIHHVLAVIPATHDTGDPAGTGATLPDA